LKQWLEGALARARGFSRLARLRVRFGIIAAALGLL
jgi:hypothetical protein